VRLDKDKEQKIIKDLEERFERLLKVGNHCAIERAVTLLVDYYFKMRDTNKVKEILLKFEKVILTQAEQVSPLIANAWLEKLYRIHLRYGLKDEANKISIKIKELSKKHLSELKKIEMPIEISEKEIDELISKLIDGDLKSALINVAVCYIPKREEVIKQLKNLSQVAPLYFLFSREILDRDGRAIATVEPLEKDIDGHVVLQISQNMQITSIILRKTIDALIKKFNLNAKKLVNYFYESPIFDEERREFFIRGIEAYLNGDFLVALHILIPQIEALIRNLAEKIDVPILKPSRSGGFDYRTLHELLSDEGIINVLGEDMSLYLRVLLTDKRGWNLRNNICHGISKAEDFNQRSADWILHALLCLSLVREKKEKQ